MPLASEHGNGVASSSTPSSSVRQRPSTPRPITSVPPLTATPATTPAPPPSSSSRSYTWLTPLTSSASSSKVTSTVTAVKSSSYHHQTMSLQIFSLFLVLLTLVVMTHSAVTDVTSPSLTGGSAKSKTLSSTRRSSLSGQTSPRLNGLAIHSSEIPVMAQLEEEKVHDVSKLVPPNRRANKKRILVTGGAGFIGSHLVDRLMDEGHMVIVVDSLFTGKKNNLQRHFSNPRFEFIRQDVVEPLYVEVDQIYHLACPASPIHYKYNPIHTLKTSFMGTYNMLGLAKRTHARFLITSTSEVYGDPLVHPQVEDYWGNVNPIGERSCYDEGKRVAETLCYDFKRQNGVDIRIARIFNTYGPRMALNDGRVVSNFVGQAIRGDKLTIQGTGNQTRSFCYVSDQVDGLIRLMNTEDVEGPVNIGNPSEFTIRELAEVVRKVVEPRLDVTFTQLTPDDPKQRKPDITKANDVLGWRPNVALEDGLKRMAVDFRDRISNGDESW